MKKKYPRNMLGYGSSPPKVKWPNNSKIAVQFVLNYEEGGENCVLHGDKYSETFLSEIIGAKSIKGRHLNMESLYEYGSRVGFWRIHKLFKEYKIPLTIYLHADQGEVLLGKYYDQGLKIIEFAKKNKIPLILDLENGLDLTDFRDGIHLNEKGQRKLAKTVLNYIKQSSHFNIFHN